jgi:hypothetical protein
MVVGTVLALSLTATGCAATLSNGLAPVRKLESSGFDPKAKAVCSKTGSPAIPLSGPTRLIAAVDSMVAQARHFALPADVAIFQQAFAGTADDACVALRCVALCVASEVKVNTSERQYVVLADLPDDGDGAPVAVWQAESTN